MAKATHSGHCQICGSTQKLPDGLLSKHGYTTRYGFFEGVCYGAGQLPFEQSKDLIETGIAMATARAIELDANAETISNPATVTEAFKSKTRRDGTREWTAIAIDDIEVRRDESGTIRQIKISDRFEYAYGTSLAEIIAKSNSGNRAHDLRKSAQAAREYCDWQRTRIVDWAPAELTAL